VIAGGEPAETAAVAKRQRPMRRQAATEGLRGTRRGAHTNGGADHERSHGHCVGALD